MNFSNLHRAALVQQLTLQTFDLLVVGGGITGCGIALDAALRGLKVALIEKDDFASGTSSRSTKLIHGGLRYLKQMEIKLVHDVGSERAVAHQNARHIVLPEKMLLPIVEDGSLGKWTTSVGLAVYDWLAGVKKGERRQMLDKHATAKEEPLLKTEKLLGGGLYFEYRTDDSRLTIEVAKSAFAQGALLLNYVELESFLHNEENKICGVKATEKIGGSVLNIRAKVVVNACGPWVDLLRKQDHSLKGKRLRLTKGVHVVFPYAKLPVKQAVYFDVADGRMIFAIPRNNITYVGTTDTGYNQEIDTPQCHTEDAKYLIAAVNETFKVQLQLSDIESSWAGLRPLINEDGKSPEELSRKDEIMVSDSGLISIAGGKLTGYRLMAKKVVDLAAKVLHRNGVSCSTKNFRLSGGEFESEADFENCRQRFLAMGKENAIAEDKITEWFFRYGSNTQLLFANAKELSADYPLKPEAADAAEIKYAVEHEMVYTLNDFLIRRTGKIFFDKPQSEQHIEELAKLLARQLGLSEEQQKADIEKTKQEYRTRTAF